MMRHDRFSSMGCRLEIAAEIGDEFREFAPYVPAVDAAGAIAFQACLQDGRTGVWKSLPGQPPQALTVGSGTTGEVISHPVINQGGDVMFYAQTGDQRTAFVRLNGEAWDTVMSSGQGCAEVGPLGPTLTENRLAAFRALSGSGLAMVGRCGLGHPLDIATWTVEPGETVVGLPCIERNGDVIVRVDRVDGVQTIQRFGSGGRQQLVTAAELGVELGSFPHADGEGGVTFVGKSESGACSVFLHLESQVHLLFGLPASFESVRGSLSFPTGRGLYYATPKGGKLGIYYGPDPVQHCVLHVGSLLFNRIVSEFALNPVSMNAHGDFAVRVGWEGGGGAIVRGSLL